VIQFAPRTLTMLLSEIQPAVLAATEAHTAVCIGKQVAQGLSYLHQHSMVHGSLSPSNVCLGGDAFEVKLTDFGRSKRLIHYLTELNGEALDATAQGDGLPHPYAAPEQLSLEKWSASADIYSLGALLARMASAAPLYHDALVSSRWSNVFHRICCGEASVLDQAGNVEELPAQLVELVRRCVNLERRKRPQVAFCVRQLDTMVENFAFEERSLGNAESSLSRRGLGEEDDGGLSQSSEGTTEHLHRRRMNQKAIRPGALPPPGQVSAMLAHEQGKTGAATQRIKGDATALMAVQRLKRQNSAAAGSSTRGGGGFFDGVAALQGDDEEEDGSADDMPQPVDMARGGSLKKMSMMPKFGGSSKSLGEGSMRGSRQASMKNVPGERSTGSRVTAERSTGRITGERSTDSIRTEEASTCGNLSELTARCASSSDGGKMAIAHRSIMKGLADQSVTLQANERVKI